MTFPCVERIGRVLLAVFLIATAVFSATIVPAQANDERALYLHYTHTKETARIVFKRNGRYVQQGLDQLNVFLRDWRRNEPARMDPALFDLLWEVYRETGSNQPIHVVSAYRSPATNQMLRANSSGVAENSQHMRGQAIDFYIPGVPASRLREIGFRKQVGGVGYYPSSGSPFVHLDTGTVRAWPRMTTAQLQQIFPDGRTLHVPSNGVVLSQEGYRSAQAEWNQCRRVPCSGGTNLASGGTQVAESRGTRSLLDAVFGGRNQSAPTQTAAAPAPAAPPQPVPQQPAAAPAPVVSAAPATPSQPAAAPVEAPTPPVRPDGAIAVAAAPAELPFAFVDSETLAQDVAAIAAPTPPQMPRDLRQPAAAPAPAGGNDGALAIAALDGPVPLQRPESNDARVVSAYAPASGAATRIETAALVAPVPAPRPVQSARDEVAAATQAVTAASFAPQMGLEAFADFFSGPILPRDAAPDAATANALAALTAPEGTLFAPDLGEVDRTLLAAAPLSGEGFAVPGAPATAGDSEAYRLALRPSPGNRAEADGRGDAETIWVTLQ